jgi:hypothetical protein
MVGAFVVISTLCSIRAICQVRKSDVEHDGFKGKVRTVLTETAKPKEKDGKLKESRREFASKWAYDAEGNLVEEQIGRSRRLYRYASDGNRYEKRTTGWMSGGAPTALDFQNQRDRAAGGSGIFKWVSSYDLAGNRIEETVFSGARESHARFLYKYDNSGRRIEVTLEAQGSPTKRFVYSYDDTGRIQERLEHSGTDPVAVRRSQYFEFDSAGNWVKSQTLARRKKGGRLYFEPAEVTYRTITYY